MTGKRRILAVLTRYWREEQGAALVELAFVVPLFLLIFLGIIDFGRLGYDVVAAEKAMQRVARIAVVRPAACANVPNTTVRDPNNTNAIPPRFGTACNAGGLICRVESTVSCTLQAGITANNATAIEIWSNISTLMPANASAANVLISYADSNVLGSSLRLGFLGGPYIPVVTAQVQNLTFDFVTPIGALARLAGAGSVSFSRTIQFPALSVTLPGEDLAAGEAG